MVSSATEWMLRKMLFSMLGFSTHQAAQQDFDLLPLRAAATVIADGAGGSVKRQAHWMNSRSL